MGEQSVAPGRSTIAAIVLAAGRSSRMGTHKMLLPLGGRPLVAHTVAAACASHAEHVIVVVGHEAARVRAALAPGRYVVVENPNHAQGMATSLRAGLAAVPSDCSGVLVVLGDQPLQSTKLLNRLIDAANATPDHILAASYDGKRGNPVYFARRFFHDLEAVTGDEGGRSVLRRHATDVIEVECGDLAPNLDADTPEDFARIQREWTTRLSGPDTACQ